MNTRYSITRVQGAKHTAATKLTDTEHEALRQIALACGISAYEAVRLAIQAYIRRPRSK